MRLAWAPPVAGRNSGSRQILMIRLGTRRTKDNEIKTGIHLAGWLQADPELRSKTRVETDLAHAEECPMWSFDGSSTLQAAGDDSDCLLGQSRYSRILIALVRTLL